jgi:hypothetical protein
MEGGEFNCIDTTYIQTYRVQLTVTKFYNNVNKGYSSHKEVN